MKYGDYPMTASDYILKVEANLTAIRPTIFIECKDKWEYAKAKVLEENKVTHAENMYTFFNYLLDYDKLNQSTTS